MSDFDDLTKYCQKLKDAHVERDRLFAGMEEMYLLAWQEEIEFDEAATVKVTKDPDPSNALTGAHRLLSVTDPVVSVAKDTNSAEAVIMSEAMERDGRMMLDAAGKVGNRPVHFDAALSGLLYSEVQILVDRTADLYDQAEGASPAVRRNAERLMRRTPYLYNVVNPRTGYPVFDRYGALREYYRESDMTVAQLIDEWGEMGRAAARERGFDAQEDKLKGVTVCSFMDLTERAVWLKEGRQPMYRGDHGWVNLPVVDIITDGTLLFDKPEYQRRPFLSTEYRTGMWQRRNLALTVLFTLLANFGMSPTYVFKKARSEDKLPQLVEVGLLAMMALEPGQELAPMLNKGLIDPALMTALEIAERKGEESTMYKAALGGFLGGGTAYSTHALLSQLGRIPLDMVRRMVGVALAEALRISFEWMRAEPDNYTVFSGGISKAIDVASIPEFFELTVDLDVALPQDKLNQANVFNALYGKVPTRFLAEEILGIGQYEAMMDELFSEQATQVYLQAYIQQMAALVQQAQAMAAQPGAAPAGQGGAPGDMNAMLAGGGGGGLPPELAVQAAAGGQGPMQPGAPAVEAGAPGGLGL